MKLKLILSLLALSFYGKVLSGWFGIGTPKSSKSIYIHSSNYGTFVTGYKPDSVIAVFRQPKSFGKPSDSTGAVFYIQGSWILSYRKKETDFTRDAGLNRQLIQQLITTNDLAYFRLFYINTRGQVYKYEDITAKGKRIREGVLTDAATLSLEIQKFYENGVVSNRTQYKLLQPDSLEKRKYDSLWYDLNPKLVKSGREEIYYQNQNPVLTRVYTGGVLRDSLYTELYSNGTIKKTYTTKGGLLEGPAKMFGKDGKLREELIFEKGKLARTVLPNINFDQRKKALLFGIDRYSVPAGQKTGGPWKRYEVMNLAGCVNDVDTLRSVLVTRKGFAPENVIVLTDDKAAKTEVMTSFRKLIASLKKGDFVFLHFSGHGIQLKEMADSLRHFEGLAIPCRDWNYPADTALSNSNVVFQYHLEEFFNNIKKQIGKTGQLVISLDVSHSGQLLSYGGVETTSEQPIPASRRGESNNILFNLVKDETAPVIILTSATADQFGYEMRGDNGEAYGAYTLALVNSLTSPWTLNTAELHEEITAFLKKNGPKQDPGYLASKTQFLFEEADVPYQSSGLGTLPVVQQRGNAFLLSVGISEYSSQPGEQLRFTNCEADAKKYAAFFEKQFDEAGMEKGKKKLYSSQLINKQATKEAILASINNVISNSTPDDYFIFNFSGYCRPLKDSSGKKVTYFVPYGLPSISDTAEIKQKGISLTQLKDLLQMIPANNQLFITEAGSTDEFQREFIQALIETSPTIASLSNKNRIFIVPNGSGLDNFICKGAAQEHGPINYFVTNLTDELNIFGLFEGGTYADAVRFNLNKTAVDCDYFRTGYFDVFFERDFIRNLSYFLPEEVMKSRGAGLINRDKAAVANAIAKKYALLVGTNTYSGKPQWTDLDGIPITDVTSIGAELSNNYGFNVIPLVDKPSDSIYENIIRLSRILKPNDQLLIYVAGHGDYDDQLFDDGFIVCANSKQAKDDPYRNSYIQYSKLSRMINKLPASQVMMVLDVCFGGSFAEKVVRCSNRSGYEDLSSADYISGKLKLKTRLFLSSGGRKEVPNGYKGRLSPFAQRFLQCLQTRGGDGKLLSSSSFYEFVKKLPSGPVIGSFGDDECGSEFLMLSK